MNTKALAPARALLDAGLMFEYEHRLSTKLLFSFAGGLRLNAAESGFKVACQKFGQKECFGVLVALWLEKELVASADGYHLIPFEESWSMEVAVLGLVRAE